MHHLSLKCRYLFSTLLFARLLPCYPVGLPPGWALREFVGGCCRAFHPRLRCALVWAGDRCFRPSRDVSSALPCLQDRYGRAHSPNSLMGVHYKTRGGRFSYTCLFPLQLFFKGRSWCFIAKRSSVVHGVDFHVRLCWFTLDVVQSWTELQLGDRNRCWLPPA